MFRRFFTRKSAPLSGVPEIRRLKTYSAQSGYVYQYFYEGHRASGAVTEFVFTISADRKNWAPAKVLMSDAAIHQWEQDHTRELNATERYAVAKMALFQAFDERASPDLMREDIRVRTADIQAIIETLGL